MRTWGNFARAWAEEKGSMARWGWMWVGFLAWSFLGSAGAWGAGSSGSVHLQVTRFESRTEAEQAASDLRAGKGFEHLAAQWVPEGLRETQGYLGEVVLERLSAPVQDVLGRLGPGQVSPPVAAEGAWFIFRVLGPEEVSRYSPGQESAIFHLERGIILGELGDTFGELDSYRRAIHLDAGLAAAHVNLGEALRRQAMRLLDGTRGSPSEQEASKATEILDEAIDEFKAAIGLDNELWEAHFNLGLAYAAQGLLELTVLEFQEAIRLRPEAAEIHRALGTALLMEGRLEEARKHAQRAGELGAQVEDLLKRIEKEERKARGKSR